MTGQQPYQPWRYALIGAAIGLTISYAITVTAALATHT